MSARWLVFVLCVSCAAGGQQEQRPSALDLLPAPTAPRDDHGVFASPRLQHLLDEVTCSRRVPGNTATLLVNGAAIERRIETGRDAEVILAKTFQIQDDLIGRKMAALLMERARAGAYVVLQYEFKVNLGGLSGLRQMHRYASRELPLGEPPIVHQLRQAGVIIVPTNSPSRIIESSEWANNAARFATDPAGALERTLDSLQILEYHDHERYWITGKHDDAGHLRLNAILGGTSLESPYGLGGTATVDPITGDHGWRDTDVEVRGPVVNQIVDRFIDLMEYHMDRGQPGLRARMNQAQLPAGDVPIRFIWNHPAVQNLRTVENAYRVLIDATPPGDVVRIETAYFEPTGGLLQSLTQAVRRGTRLTILTNSAASNNHPAISYATRTVFSLLLGIDPHVVLLERVPRPDIGEETLHSKVASFGTRGPVIIGSANLDGESQDHSTESIVIIDDPAFRRAFDDMFVRDIAADRVDRITRADLRRESGWVRARDWTLYHLPGHWL